MRQLVRATLLGTSRGYHFCLFVLYALLLEKIDAILLVVALASCLVVLCVVVVRSPSGNVIWSPWRRERHFTGYLGLWQERGPLSPRTSSALALWGCCPYCLLGHCPPPLPPRSGGPSHLCHWSSGNITYQLGSCCVAVLASANVAAVSGSGSTSRVFLGGPGCLAHISGNALRAGVESPAPKN
jgi:hypothetical protein